MRSSRQPAPAGRGALTVAPLRLPAGRAALPVAPARLPAPGRLAPILVAALLVPTLGAADPAPERPAPYDASPFRESIRPDALASVEKAVSGLASLPRYLIQVEVDPEKGTLIGTQQLGFTHDRPGALSRVVLRTYPNGLAGAGSARRLVISRVEVGGVAATVVERSPTYHEVELPQPLPQGSFVTLDITFKGIVPELPPGASDPALHGAQTLAGLLAGGLGATPVRHAEDRGLFARDGGIATLSWFFPALASHRLDGELDPDEPPLLGEPSRTDPANFLLAVVAPEGVKVATSGCEVGSVPTPDGRRRTSVVAAAHRDLGLLLSRDFVLTERQAGGVKLRGFAVEQDRLAGERAADLAARDLAALEKLISVRYPWACLTVAEAGLAAGAGSVEFPSLVALSAALYHPAPGTGALLEPSLAHGLAHQWFGAVVGNDGARDPVIDEALAEYATVLTAERAGGSRAAAMRRLRDGYDLYRLLGNADGKADRPVDGFASSAELAALLLGKAPHAFHELRQLLGEKGFAAWLRDYVRGSAFRVVDRVAMLAAVPGARRRRAEQLFARHWDEARGDETVGPPDPSRLAGQLGAAPQVIGRPGPGATPFGGPSQPMQPGPPGQQQLTPAEQQQLRELQEQLAPMFEEAIRALGGDPP